MSIRSFLVSLFSFWAFCLNAVFGAPVVTSVTPFVGPSTGGTVVTIAGSGFTGSTAVFFGGTPAATFFVVNDNTITATSPPHSPETIVVTVTTPSGTSTNDSKNDASFVYRGDWEAYVANSGSNNVSVIDTSTNTVVATPMVGFLPIAITITPDSTQSYVANANSGTISVINNATNTVKATISVGNTPSSIAITPDGAQAYVANLGNNTVSVINTTTNTVSTTIAVGSAPDAIAITPDGAQAYVANQFSNTVSVINTAINAVTATIPVGTQPLAIAITPDGIQVYVVNLGSNTVSVINSATNTVSTTITVNNPFAIAITPDSMQAYVVNRVENISAINTATNTVSTTITVGILPAAIAITPDSTQAYVANQFSDTVSVINTATNTVSTTIPVGHQPDAIAITPDGTHAYVTNQESDTVSVINTAKNTVIATVPVGGGPRGISITPDQAPLAKFTVTIAPAGLPSTFDASQSTSPVGTIVNYFWDFGDGTTLNTAQPVVSHTYASPGTYTVRLVVTNSAGTSTSQIFNIASNSTNLLAPISTFITNNGGPSAIAIEMITIPSIAPLIQTISPSSGSVCGGTTVTITGVNFTGATAVFFGSIPATQFTVQSDTTIVAISPPGMKPMTVDITVVTPFGTSAITAADQFTFLPLSPPRELRGHQVKNRFATQTDIINILTWKAPSHTRNCAPVAYRIFRDAALKELIAEVSAYQKLEFNDHNRKEGKTYAYFVVSVDRFGNVSQPAKVIIKGGR